MSRHSRDKAEPCACRMKQGRASADQHDPTGCFATVDDYRARAFLEPYATIHMSEKSPLLRNASVAVEKRRFWKLTQVLEGLGLG